MNKVCDNYILAAMRSVNEVLDSAFTRNRRALLRGVYTYSNSERHCTPAADLLTSRVSLAFCLTVQAAGNPFAPFRQ